MYKVPEGYVTHAIYAQTNGLFKKVCSALGIENTARQASKWRNETGSAWNHYQKNKHQFDQPNDKS